MDNKLLFAVLLILSLGGVFFWARGMSSGDTGLAWVPMAIAPAKGEQAKLHVSVGILVIKKDGLRRINGRLQSWSEWTDDHFLLRDAAGEKVNFTRTNFSDILPEKIAGPFEFFLEAQLRPGQQYTLGFVPFVDDGRRFEYAFTAPTAGKEAEKVACELVESD